MIDRGGPWPSHEVAWEFVFNSGFSSCHVLIRQFLLFSVDSEPRILNSEKGSAPVSHMPVVVVGSDDAPWNGAVALGHGYFAVGAVATGHDTWWGTSVIEETTQADPVVGSPDDIKGSL